MIDQNSRDQRGKTILLGSLVLLGFLILGGRLFQMQVLVWEEYLAQSDENRIRPERVAALRGQMFDRNGVVLADSRPTFSVSVIPYLVQRNEAVLDRLVALVGADRAVIDRRLAEGLGRPYEPHRVLYDVDIRIVSIVEEHSSELPGVLIESEPVRRYPNGRLAAHVLGYLGKISEEELLAARAAGGNLTPGARVGRTGVEKEYEAYLSGKDGVRYVQEDARGRPLGTLRETSPVPGEDLWLTIDTDLQTFAESLITSYRMESSVVEQAGAIVAMDPKTGDILAMASCPTFDPNLFSVNVPIPVWDSLSQDPMHPLLNRASQAAYPPGSTYKPITAALGIIDDHVRPETRLLPCFGSYRLGRRTYRCWEERGHGSLDLARSMERSCDVYFYQIGQEMNLDHFAELSTAFGFGKRTGIDMPADRAGLVPTIKYMNNRYGRDGWGAGYLLNHSIGQGEILTTPLQIARFFGALGTGALVRPRLLLRVIDAEGSQKPGRPALTQDVSIAPSLLALLQGAVEGVVANERGTGGAARVTGIRVAGKTGTAENPHGLEHAWFVAYAPADDPQIVVSCLLEEAGHGGSEAAPIVGALLRRFFRVKDGV